MPEVNYFWDEVEDNVVREYDDNNLTLANYTSEPTLYGSVLSQDRGGEVRQYHFDGQGNTTELTDVSGDVTDTRQYSSFGDVTQSSGSTSFPFQYGGKFGYAREAESHRHYVRRRMLQSTILRWMSLDPRLSIADLNLYRYAYNRPLYLDDPSGLAPQLRNRGSADNGAEGSSGISESEKKAMAACKCKVFVAFTQDYFKEQPEILGYVTCDDPGGFKVNFNTLNGVAKGMIDKLRACNLLKCVDLHESRHIDHFFIACPDFCCDDAIPRDVAIGFEDAKCKAASECFAYKAEARCAIDQIKANLLDPSKKGCVNYSRTYLKQIKNSLTAHCKPQDPKLDKEIEDLRRKLELQGGFGGGSQE